MRHKVNKIKIGNTKAHQNSLVRSMTKNLLENGHIRTTKARAKVLISNLERILNKAITRDLNYIQSLVGSPKVAKKVLGMTEDKEKGDFAGFVRMYKYGYRKGDGSLMYEVVLADYEPKKVSNLTVVKK